ncbi:hypothetical protein PROP_00856 [Propionicimonas sp. T2.31MG-18]|uniref:YlxR family protein n=1 Tax=Propionicimonas sp. T2.31MG-18 TaxID=3157620 RepID=UPI0035EAE4C7
MIGVRTCIGCRGTAGKAELVRLVWNPGTGTVVVDGSQVMPGRGCYLHPGCAAAVVKRRAVARALRRPVDGSQVARLLGVPD